jgi:hypothetical protein
VEQPCLHDTKGAKGDLGFCVDGAKIDVNENGKSSQLTLTRTHEGSPLGAFVKDSASFALTSSALTGQWDGAAVDMKAAASPVFAGVVQLKDGNVNVGVTCDRASDVVTCKPQRPCEFSGTEESNLGFCVTSMTISQKEMVIERTAPTGTGMPPQTLKVSTFSEDATGVLGTFDDAAVDVGAPWFGSIKFGKSTGPDGKPLDFEGDCRKQASKDGLTQAFECTPKTACTDNACISNLLIIKSTVDTVIVGNGSPLDPQLTGKVTSDLKDGGNTFIVTAEKDFSAELHVSKTTFRGTLALGQDAVFPAICVQDK